MARILVVDGDPLYRDMIHTVLERSGHWVCSAESGRQGLRQLEDARFDVVVADLSMPHVEIHRWLSDLRVQSGGASVIGLSGGIGTTASAKGMAAVVAKPFTADDLLGALTQVLRIGKFGGDKGDGDVH